MKISLTTVAFLILSTVACVSEEDIRSHVLADVMPDGEVKIASALARAGAEPCAKALRVNLLSQGTSGLRIETYRPIEDGCAMPPGYPAHAYYDVKTIEYYAGRKTYLAGSALGALWLHDDRQTEADNDWTLVTHDFESPLVPGFNATQTYAAATVADENLRASGETSYWVRVRLQKPLEQAEVEKMVFSLLIDTEASRPVDNSEQTAYDLLVISDFPVAHVLSQIRKNALVMAADLR
jgi:hypothetical protein